MLVVAGLYESSMGGTAPTSGYFMFTVSIGHMSKYSTYREYLEPFHGGEKHPASLQETMRTSPCSISSPACQSAAWLVMSLVRSCVLTGYQSGLMTAEGSTRRSSR